MKSLVLFVVFVVLCHLLDSHVVLDDPLDLLDDLLDDHLGVTWKYDLRGRNDRQRVEPIFLTAITAF